jgi:hypothetical protein
VIGTIFGIATTLGIGVVQLNYGLSVLFDIPDSMAAKAALIALSVIIATISVTSGVDKGIRVLSELNVALALGLILFVLFMGDTSFLLNALSAQRWRLREPLYGHDAEQLRLRPSGGVDEQLDAVLLGVVGGVVAVCRPVPGAYFAWAHHPPVCDGHADYPVHLYPAVAVGVRQQRAV